MLKQLATVILLMAFLVQTFNKAIVVTGYYTNTAAYAKNCENKAKPQLHCNGKCQMMKKLKQEEKKDEQNPERRSSAKDEVLYSNSHFISVNCFYTNISINYSTQLVASTIDRASDVFHPPGV